MNTQQNMQNLSFIENRKIYYYLKSVSILAEDELINKSNSFNNTIYESFHSGKKRSSDFTLTKERLSLCKKMSSITGYSIPSLSFSIISLSHLKNNFYNDLSEFKGKYSIKVSLIYNNHPFTLKRINSYTVKNILPPVVNFFSLFLKKGFSSNINNLDSPENGVIFSNNKGIVYTGSKKVIFNLCAGLEEFRLPKSKYIVNPDGVEISKFFCFSEKYKKLFNNPIDLSSSRFQLFGTNLSPSIAPFFGNGEKRAIKIPALFKKKGSNVLDNYHIEKDKISIYSSKIPISQGINNLIYNKFSKDINIIDNKNRLFFKNNINEINIIKMLNSKIDIRINSLRSVKGLLKCYSDHSELNMAGRIIQVKEKINLNNVHVTSPGIIICSSDSKFSNIHSNYPFTIVSEKALTISGDIDAYIICCSNYPSLHFSNRFRINGGIAACEIDAENIYNGGNVIYNNSFYDYFNTKNYMIVRHDIQNGVFFNEK